MVTAMSTESPPRAVLTGGSSDIGRALLARLQKDGWLVEAQWFSTTPDRAMEETVRWTKVDLSLGVEATHFARSALDRLGGVDAFISCAGREISTPTTRHRAEEFDRVVQLNLSSVFAIAGILAPSMMMQRSGRMIFLSSVSGRIGVAGQAAYSAAKAGLEGLSRSLAAELAPWGITVNCVAPGPVDGRYLRSKGPSEYARLVAAVPAGRMGMPSEIAHTLSFLLDPESGFITGQTIVADGGQSAVLFNSNADHSPPPDSRRLS